MSSSDAPGERDALLPQDTVAKRRAAPTPLPWTQLAIVFAIKLTIPITLQQMMPYINELLARVVQRPSNEIGYYSGLLSMVMYATQTSSAYPWGRVSDRIGRRLPLFGSLLFLIIANILFGVANSLPELVFARVLIGLGIGAVGIMHSVVGELTDQSNASTAFPLYDTVAAVGFVIGPLFGGLLVHPAESFPSVFASPFWIRFPYLLPCFVTAVYAAFALALAVVALKETNSRSIKQGQHEHLPDTERTTEAVAPPPGAKELLLKYPMLRYISASSGAIGFTAAAFNNFFVLLAYSDLADGGLQLNPAKIGVALSIMGLVSIPLKLSLPFILTRMSTLGVFRIAMHSWPITFASLPLLGLLARVLGPDRTGTREALLWVAISTVLFLSRVGCMAFGLIMLLVKEHTPETSALGAVNGITEVVQMAGILIGPPIITSLFAYSVTNNILSGYLWAVVIIVISLGLARIGDIMVRYEAATVRAVRERED